MDTLIIKELFFFRFRFHYIILFPDQTLGRVEEDKLCGAPEDDSLYAYKTGCDGISVPFKQTECYCRGELCNGAQPTSSWANGIVTLVSVFFGVALSKI